MRVATASTHDFTEKQILENTVIPAVVGARTALVDISDGAQVEVDPIAGFVRILS